MKRLLTILTVMAALLASSLPVYVAVCGDGNATEWTGFAAQARSKSKKNKRKKKQKKPAKSRQSLRQQQPAAQASVPTVGNTSLQMGLPRGMANNTVRYKAITVWFNPNLRIPNCVGYELTATMVSMADAPDHENRKNYRYSQDTRVTGCPDHWEYRGSGYTRGHMAPAMDMRWDPQAMADCFLMTNMCPQETKLNNDHWRKLEERVHGWAKRYHRLLVFTGPIMGSHPGLIGKEHKNIAVPDAFFKVVYAPQQGRSIAFIYRNGPCPGSFSKYAVPVAEVERRTGFTFPAAIPRNQCSPQSW